MSDDMIWIRWSASEINDKNWTGDLAPRVSTLLPSWASRPSNAIAAVERATSNYFDDPSEWNNCFEEAVEATIHIEVHEPESIAGRYAVTVRIDITARAEAWQPEEAA